MILDARALAFPYGKREVPDAVLALMRSTLMTDAALRPSAGRPDRPFRLSL